MLTRLVFPSGNNIKMNDNNKIAFSVHLGDELRYDGVTYDVIRVIHAVDHRNNQFSQRTIILGSKWVF